MGRDRPGHTFGTPGLIGRVVGERVSPLVTGDGGTMAGNRPLACEQRFAGVGQPRARSAKVYFL